MLNSLSYGTTDGELEEYLKLHVAVAMYANVFFIYAFYENLWFMFWL